MTKCAMPGCKETGHHSFPKDKNKKRLWAEAIRRPELMKSQSPYLRLCGRHFTENDFKTVKSTTGWKLLRKFLKDNAVPSVFLGYKSLSPYAAAKKKRLQNGNKSTLTHDAAHFDHSYSIQDGTQSAEPEEEPKVIFSWQKETEIVDDDNDGVVCPSVGEALGLPGPAEYSLYCDDEPAADESRAETIPSTELPAEYQCNECRKEIVGFRYACVQCADWDLCGACEARTAHATHYVLRVPSPRPYNEVQAVLKAIRLHLLGQNVFSNRESIDDSLTLEVKEEQPEPLASWDSDLDDFEIKKQELEIDFDEDPIRKRARSSSQSSKELSHSPPDHPTISGSDRHTHDTLTLANKLQAWTKKRIVNRREKHKSRFNTPARRQPQNKPSIDQNNTSLLFTVGVDKPTRHRTSRQTARTTSGDDLRLTSNIEPNAPSVADKRVFLKLPPGTDTRHLLRALQSEVTVQLETIEGCVRASEENKRKPHRRRPLI